MTADVVPAELAAACDQVSLGTQADAVGGLVPRYVAAPASTEEASAVLRAAARLGLALVPRGGGTRLDWGAAPARCDLVVDTGLMGGVLEHAAGDLVVRVQAGTRLTALAEVLAKAGQRLALDPPAAGPNGGGTVGGGTEGGGTVGGGTVGGLVATGVAGPLRLRFGAPRDLLIGITIVRADGTVARAGGKVVKNVAGYDISRLLAGSYGTLGLITEATFRLHPLPPAAAYVSARTPDPAAAATALLTAAGSTLAPSAAELDWPGAGAPLEIGVLLEGDPDGVGERAARLADLLAEVPGLDGEVQVSDAAPAWWSRGAAVSDGTLLRIAFWAGRLESVLGAVREAAAEAGLDPAVGGSAAGVLHASLPADTPTDKITRFVTTLRHRLHPTPPSPPPPATTAPAAPDHRPGPGAGTAEVGGVAEVGASVAVLVAPSEVRGAVDLWGPVPALALMRAVKDQFDPEHRLAPGRFAGGI
jgi:glycolate oxidase FAD binding subunit